MYSGQSSINNERLVPSDERGTDQKLLQYNCETQEISSVCNNLSDSMRNVYSNLLNYFRDVRLSILKLVHWTAVDRHTAITNVEFEEFQSFVKYFTDHIYVQSLVQGNMTKGDAIKNVQECVKILKCDPLLPNTMPQIRIAQIQSGAQYCKVRNFNSTDVNSVVMNYYECGLASVKLLVLIEVIIVSENCGLN